MPPSTNQAPIVLIDDAHTFGGTQIALAWTVRVLLDVAQIPVICVCTPQTRAAVEKTTGSHPLLRFEDAPAALPLNLFLFPLRIPAWWQLLRRLQSDGASAWWLNLPDIEFGLAPLIVMRLLGIVPCSYLHGTTRFQEFHKNAPRWRRWLSVMRDSVADCCAFGLHRLLIAPSESSRQELLLRLSRLQAPPTAFLYPPGSPPVAASLQQQTPASDTEAIELWIVGNLVQGHKNQIAALETTALLRRRGFDARLTIVGVGPDLEMLRQHARELGIMDLVSWAGWLDSPWQNAPPNAVVIVPSWRETLSLVAREALGHGLCVVVSPLAVFQEWVPPVMIAKSTSPEDLADAILEIRRTDRASLDLAIQKSLSRFSTAGFIQDFLKLSRVVQTK